MTSPPASEPDPGLAPSGPDQAATTGAEEPGRRGRRRRRRQSWLTARLGPTGANVVEWVVVIGGAVALALVVKVFLLQAFFIPSASMYPTLQKDDRVLVNKLSYRFGDVGRGDVVVFERPPNETASDIPDLIKRVVGLPGESVVIEGGHVYVDGRQLEEGYLPEGTTTSTEHAPNKCSREAPCLVPEGEVWVMGDNRNDSKDSRYFGTIDEDTIVGRAFMVVWPFDRISWL